MSGKKKDDPKEGVSEKLIQQAISYFVSHPDVWMSRNQMQKALDIGKTQACRLYKALTYVLPCLESNEVERNADNSPLKYRLTSDSLKRAEKELYQISSLTSEDRTILTILIDMADSTGLYGDMIGKLKEHLSLSRFAEKGIIPMVSYSPDMQAGGEGQKFVPEILKAIDQNKSVWITYKSPWSEEKKYTINPIGIFSQNDILYLFSYNPYFNHTMVHAFSRIRNIEMFEDAVTPEEFKDLSLIIDPFGIATDDEPIIVKVWIDPDQAIFEKESARSKNAQITENEDGSIIMSVQTRSRYACKKWILSLGCQSRCLEPKDLVEEIRSELSALVDQY